MWIYCASRVDIFNVLFTLDDIVTPDAYLINDKDTEEFTEEYQIVHHYFVKEGTVCNINLILF